MALELDVILELLVNLTMLISLSIVAGFVDKRWPRTTRPGRLLQGFLFGAVAIIGMLRPLDFGNGLIFDGRSVMVGLCALYFGRLATVVAVIMLVVVRVSIGGVGVYMGVLVVLSSAIIGLFARRWLKSSERSPSSAQIYVMGLAIHIVMIALMFTLPEGLIVIRKVGLPVILLYPLAMILAGKILSDQMDASRTLMQLRDSEKDLRDSQRIAHVGSWRLDVASNRVVWSDELYRMYGFDPALPPPPYTEHQKLFTPASWAALSAALQNTRDTGIPYELELETVWKDGSNGWMWVHGEAIPDASGKTVTLWGAAQDITERKQAEQDKAKLQSQLQQAMKMEAIGRLAGGVAHDFNNLLTGIIGNVGLAMVDVKPDDPVADRLTEAHKAADIAATLTRQMLSFSREQIIEPKVLNLNDILSSMHKMLSRLIGEDIELLTMPSERPAIVKVDSGQFEQILVNLAVNARDAMPDGGKLIVETGQVELDSEYCSLHPDVRPGAYVMLAVSDTGHGMTDEVKSHLFEPFYTTKPKGRGTGLGLSSIYGAVKQANGFIEVCSESGTGTSFKIYLPQSVETPDKPEVSDVKVGIAHMPGGTETVLIVEDEGIVRDIAVNILERLGYKVLNAADGEKAMAVAVDYKGRIDLLMTDVLMPGMNGRQLAERLVQIHPETRILFTSGYTENVIAHNGIIEEELNFIAKPYLPQALAKKLRDVLDSNA